MEAGRSILFVFGSLSDAMSYQTVQEERYRSQFPHVTSKLGVYEGGKYTVDFILKRGNG